MNIYAPKYYMEFSCIADRCKHNCCIGWEIDIDEDTYTYYKSIDGALGARLHKYISEDGDAPHFILDVKERCPFLNANGLCDLILELGEDALCQICTDHPRFRNYFDSRVEIGLGMCCEAAAELILKNSEKVSVVPISAESSEMQLSAEEEAFFAFRDQVFSVLQNREKSIQKRIEMLCDTMDIALPQKSISEWVEFYAALEQLDVSWMHRLQVARENSYSPPEIMSEQLLCYFVYRHLAGGMYDVELKQRLALAIHATLFIGTLAEDETDFLELCRMYSAEIEYSQENMEAMLNVCMS